MLGPRLESLVAAEKGAVIMAKVDIDDHSDLAIDHGVCELVKLTTSKYINFVLHLIPVYTVQANSDIVHV